MFNPEKKDCQWPGIKLFRDMACGAVLLSVLAGCASPARMQVREQAAMSAWSGRLAVQVHDVDAQNASFSASFDLKGSAVEGELAVFNPFGSQIALLRWDSEGAQLLQGGKTVVSSSLEELLQRSIGTALPVDALFEWLQGRSVTAEGWQVDMRRFDAGVISAQRISPLPEVTLRVIFR